MIPPIIWVLLGFACVFTFLNSIALNYAVNRIDELERKLAQKAKQ